MGCSFFSIMTGSLVCSPPATLQSWGFRDPERRTLSKRWFGAVLMCLNRADYTANLSILSCQAIATNTISAHLLGFSSSQSIQLAAAVRIAQSLGLHRLGSETTRNTVDREIGRRVWCQLCSQDWFGIPFSESYLINPLYSTSEPPLNCHDQDLLPLPVDTPTITSYCRFLREVASIIPQLQDDLMVRNTAYTRYEQVLAWDARLRTLVTTERPMFLSHVPIDPQWPSWIPWARRALAISSGHKIIMIHRSFLSDSFINPAFAFTRRTCLAASKTIIKEYKCVVEEDGPTLWIHQAFSVAASVILLLDVLHRSPNDRESVEHKQLAETVVEILHYHRNSMIAVRGIKLLDSHRNSRSGYKFDLTGFVKTFSVGTASGQSAGSPRSTGQQQSSTGVQVEDHRESDNVSGPGGENAGHIIEPSMGYSFHTAGLDGANSFENLLYLVNHDCFSVP
ncbi:C6 zinc finger domain-containing protein [Colletotrichum asianum]